MAPGPGSPAVLLIAAFEVAAMQKTATVFLFGTPGAPARLIPLFTKHCCFAWTQVSPPPQKVQFGDWQSASTLQLLNFVIEHVPGNGPAVHAPSSLEPVSSGFERQSAVWQKP